MKILLPNSYCYASIALAKKIKESNSSIEVWGTGEEMYGYASGSMLLDKYFKSPHNSDAQEYKDFLINIINLNNIDLVICCSDNDLIVFSEIKEHICSKFISANKTDLLLFRDKLNASLRIKQVGIEIPRVLCTNIPEKTILREKISEGSQGINLLDFSSKDVNSTFLQEYICGDEYTVDVFSDLLGHPKLIIPRKRLEIRNGMSFKTQITLDERLIVACNKISKHFYLPGLWNVQFVIKDDSVYFIELNPRFAGSGISSVVASFNYIDLYIKHFILNETLESLDFYMSKVVWGSVITRFYEELLYKLN